MHDISAIVAEVDKVPEPYTRAKDNQGRTALATARNHSRRRIRPTVRISAQIPKTCPYTQQNGNNYYHESKIWADGRGVESDQKQWQSDRNPHWPEFLYS
jgi:hypothetical protein